MEFLKAILGDELYSKVEQAIALHNGKPENAEAQVKLGNLGSGEYISKGKYATLEAENSTNTSKLTEANNLIAQLQKAAKSDEGLQAKITEYQTRVQDLEAALAKEKLESAVKVELLAAKALDVDYLAYKLREKGDLALDDSGKIKGWDEKLLALKTQHPTMFTGEGRKTVDVADLPGGSPGTMSVTREQFLKMGYSDRLKLKQENEQLYKSLANA